MAKNANYVSHKKSKLKNQDGSPQLPSASALVEGEIAINFAENVETLSIKNESGDVVTFSSDNYYTEKKLGSGFTGANSAVTVTEALENVEIDVDQVIDSGTSASTNAVATKAVYNAIVDNELVWTNAYVTLSGAVSSHTVNTNIHLANGDREKIDSIDTLSGTVTAHTANTEIHVTAADKEKLHTHSNKTELDSITGNVGTMAYEDKTSYSSATEVNTALGNKAETTALTQVNNTLTAHTADTTIHVTAADKTAWNAKVDASAIADFFDDAKYEDSGTTKVINFYHGNTIKATIDASDFIVDGMVDDVRIENGNLVIDFNTASGKQDISIPLTDIFDPSNYYDKDDIDTLVGSGFTSSSITDVIIENEEIVSAALTDLDDRKLDASAYTPTEELWESGTGLNSVVLKSSSGTASGAFAVAEGSETLASGPLTHAEGYKTSATTYASHTEGHMTKASGQFSHAEGFTTTASGTSSHAEGNMTKANGYASHVEGDNTTASGSQSHAEGYNTIASGNSSHAEGDNTKANGYASHAEGYHASATTNYSHAEGNGALASGNYSHAEGSYTTASGDTSHAEGANTTASGSFSHAEGYSTITLNNSEHASGQYNVSSSGSSTFGDSGNTLFSVGNGTANNARHNAFEIRQNGDIYITSGGTDIKLQDNLGAVVDQVIDSGTSASTNAVATKAVVDKLIEDEEIISAALTDLDERKLDASAYTPTDLSNYYTKSETSGATEISDALSGKVNSATYTGHTADTTVHFTTGTVQTQIDNSISGKVNTSDIISAITPSNSGSTAPIATKVVAENELTVSNALNDLESRKLDASAYTTTSAVTSGSTVAIESGGVYVQMDGLKLKKITQSAYDALVQAGTVDPNTLYFVTD